MVSLSNHEGQGYGIFVPRARRSCNRSAGL